MRRLFAFFAAAALPLLATSFARAEGIQNSAHDFSAATWSDQEICKPCHTPHNALDTNLTGRLWAHTLSTATYVYHGGGTSADGSTRPDGGTGSAGQSDFDIASRLCLSCHDGTVALDSFMGKEGVSDGKFIGSDADHGAATANLGSGAVANDLTNDHPVGFKALYKEYQQHGGHYSYKPAASVDTAGLKLVTSPTAVPAGTLDQNGNPVTYTNVPSISCVTCHNVHNGGPTGEEGLLRITNQGSNLCLTCHDK